MCFDPDKDMFSLQEKISHNNVKVKTLSSDFSSTLCGFGEERTAQICTKPVSTEFSEKYSNRLMIKLTSSVTTATLLVKPLTAALILHRLRPLQPAPLPSLLPPQRSGQRCLLGLEYSAPNLSLAPFHLSRLNLNLACLGSVLRPLCLSSLKALLFFSIPMISCLSQFLSQISIYLSTFCCLPYALNYKFQNVRCCVRIVHNFITSISYSAGTQQHSSAKGAHFNPVLMYPN